MVDIPSGRGLQKAAFFMHALESAALVGLLSTQDLQSWRLSLSSRTGIPAPKSIVDQWDHKPQLFLPMFSALSCVNHGTSVWDEEYWEESQKTRTNPLQWAEYSVSAGLMTWMIAISSGINQLTELIPLMGLNFMMQYTGYRMEVEKARGVTDFKPWLLTGWVMFMAIWFPIVTTFAHTVATQPGVPEFVYCIIGVMFFLFALFGINQYMYLMDRITWTQYQDRTAWLSIGAKTTLVGLCFGGLGRPNTEKT